MARIYNNIDQKFEVALNKILCSTFNEETVNGRKMNHYSDLLHTAIDSIIFVKEEKDIDSHPLSVKSLPCKAK